MPKVIFKIDPEKELEYLSFFESIASYRCTCDKLPKKWRKEIWDTGLELHKKSLINLIQNEWEMLGPSGESLIDNFKRKEQVWKRYERDYFDYIENITETSWKHDTYYNYGAVYSYPNYYNMRWERPEILTTVYDDDKPEVKIAHELFHSHQVTIFKNIIGKDYLHKVSDELIETMLILVFTEKGSPFKLDRDALIEEWKKYLDEDLQEYSDKLLDSWDTRSTFDSFTKIAIKLS